jgi:hypothetical protein
MKVLRENLDLLCRLFSYSATFSWMVFRPEPAQEPGWQAEIKMVPAQVQTVQPLCGWGIPVSAGEICPLAAHRRPDARWALPRDKAAPLVLEQDVLAGLAR